MRRFECLFWRVLAAVILFSLSGEFGVAEDNVNLKLVLLPNETNLVGEPFVLEAMIVNKGADNAWNKTVNELGDDEDIGAKEAQFAKRLPLVILPKWDDNLKIKVMRLSKTEQRKVVLTEVLSDLEWPRYYAYPDDPTEAEIRWENDNCVRRDWLLPVTLIETLGPGEYQITADYTSPIYGKLVSKPAHFVLKQPTTNKEKARISVAQAHHLATQLYDEDLDPQARKEIRDKAVALYKKTLEIDPNNDSVHFGLGDIYYRQKRYEDALEQFEFCYEKYVANNYGDGPVSIDDERPSVIKHYIHFVKEKIKQQQSN